MDRKGFTKEERSRFNYWFAHWNAFNLTALVLHHWKWKYLFHDIEKPWLRLFLPYPSVQKWHRLHNRHHIEYWIRHNFNPNSVDWEAMAIDWECSRLTKLSQQKDARRTLEQEIAKLREDETATEEQIASFRQCMETTLTNLHL